MTSFKTLRLRIKSIKSTQKITKAMQMVAASKLRRVKSDVEKAATYNTLILKTLHELSHEPQRELSGIAKIVLGEDSKNIISVVVTSERGLCGGFNQSVLRKAKTDISALRAEGLNVKIITIGKKGRDWILSHYGEDSIIRHYANPPTKSIRTDAIGICNSILQEFQNGEFDGIRLYFNEFKNTVSQIPRSKIVVPLQTSIDIPKEHKNIFESEGANLLSEVVEMYITSEIYYALLESRASEEAARMVAMDNATKNATDIIQTLTLLMNRSRQASITKELIEIISGAEAV
jgi:F-type H+-transporting ATPase subunit gamma